MKTKCRVYYQIILPDGLEIHCKTVKQFYRKFAALMLRDIFADGYKVVLKKNNFHHIKVF
jgi:hypothetical protein